MEAMIDRSTFDFSEYYQKFYHEMYYVAKKVVCSHHVAEDVIQDAFIKAYRNLAHLNDPSKGRPWLRTIVIRTAIDYYRKETKANFSSLEEDETLGQVIECPKHNTEEEMNWIEVRENIVKKIEKLPKTMREVMTIKLKTDAKDQVIATELDISLAAVKTRLHRARKMLKETSDHQI